MSIFYVDFTEVSKICVGKIRHIHCTSFQWTLLRIFESKIKKLVGDLSNQQIVNKNSNVTVFGFIIIVRKFRIHSLLIGTVSETLAVFRGKKHYV